MTAPRINVSHRWIAQLRLAAAIAVLSVGFLEPGANALAASLKGVAGGARRASPPAPHSQASPATSHGQTIPAVSAGQTTPAVSAGQTTPAVSGAPAVVDIQLSPAVADSDAWTRVDDILTVMGAAAFNPSAPGEVGGGLYVNWRGGWQGHANPLLNTDLNSNGLTDAQAGRPARHDPLTDLTYLSILTDWRSNHPGDAEFDSAIAQMEPIVAKEFNDYRYYRGWVYFELLRLDRFDPGMGWAARAEAMAKSMTHFWDPTAQLFVDPHNGTCVTADSGETAAALIDAGHRFGVPAWTTIGGAGLSRLLSYANPKTGWLPTSLSVTGNTVAVLADQATTGETAQLFDAILDAYDQTKDPQFLAAVNLAVGSMFNPLYGWWDSDAGGFFAGINADGTGLNRHYKETRQAWILPLLFQLSAIQGGTYISQINEMLTVVASDLWLVSLSGYAYRVTPAFGVYVNDEGPGHAPVSESFVTSEAMGIAAQALEGFPTPVPEQ